MGNYILRRLGQALLTVLGVMIITFMLFRGMPGDVAAANLGPKADELRKAQWRHNHGYDRPLLINVHRALLFSDNTSGEHSFEVRDGERNALATALALARADGETGKNTLMGRYIALLSPKTPIAELTANRPLAAGPNDRQVQALQTTFLLADGGEITVDFTGAGTAGELIARVKDAPGNNGRLTCRISDWSATDVVKSQFFAHLWNSISFQARSFKDNQTLWEIVRQRGPASLSVQIPALALEWFLGLGVAAFVAYYRGSRFDKAVVFLCVLGMCVPFLAFMILGQMAMFAVSPAHAYGAAHKSNVYVPVAIMVIAGLGGQVRFYRTVILDEVNRDYVRTAFAKGVSLPSVLFKHVLKNCMLPVLTSLILAIPFLIMGGLLVETFFGIPGLGDLMITSINDRNEPIMTSLVFLTAVIYTVGILITDVCYAVFDPRIRLR